MSEPNWELKDRRMAWMNMNSACSNILSARIEAGLFKPKDNAAAMKELLDAINIEFSAYLTLGTGDVNTCGGEERTPSTIAPKSEELAKKQDWKWFCGCGKGVSDKVKNFSEDKFGEVLCFDCQKKAREKIENASGPRDLEG